MNANTISDHHFYDQDISLEEKGLLVDVQEEYLNEEPKKQQVAFIAAALLCLVLLAATIIAWIQFHQRYGRLYLCHAIMCTLAFLFSLYAIVYFLGVKKSLQMNKAVSPGSSIVVYAVGLLFVGYFIGCAAYLWVYRAYFDNYTRGLKADDGGWKFHFWNHDYKRTENENYRLVLTQVILALFAALFSGLVAWGAYSFMKNTLQTKKITLMLALITMAIFATLVWIYYLNDRKRWGYVKNYFKSAGGINIMLFCFCMAVIALILAFINSVFNVMGGFQGSKVGKGYNLFFGIIWLILGIITVIFCALLFRDAYDLSLNKPMSCNQAADIAHENEYVRGWSKFCNGKYLQNGETCRKTDLYQRWEHQGGEQRSLNPGCCEVANDVVFWPFFLIGIFTFFMGICMFVAAASNIGLTSYPHDLDEHYGQLKIIDFITIGVLALLGIFLLFYLLFRPTPGFNHRYSQSMQGFNQDEWGNLTPKTTFKPIDRAVTQVLPVNDKCFPLITQDPPSFEIDQTKCTGTCEFSVGILAENGTIQRTGLKEFNAKIGQDQTRQFFFPKATDQNDDFMHIYGKPQDIQKFLSQLTVCTNKSNLNTKVALHGLQYDISKLNQNGLTKGQNPVYMVPIENGEKADLLAYNTGNATCKHECKFIVAQNVKSLIAIQGLLKIKDDQQNYINYDDLIPTIEMTLFQNINGSKQSNSITTLHKNGAFSIDTQIFEQSQNMATLNIKDASGKYLENNIDLILKKPASGQALYIGEIYLITKSGDGCFNKLKPAETKQCFDQMNVKNYDIKYQLLSIDNDLKLPAKLHVYKHQSLQSEIIKTVDLTAAEGTINLPAGNYLLVVEGDKYQKIYEKVDLDGNKISKLELKPNDEVYRIYKYFDQSNNGQDVDLNLKMRTSSGEECTVNHLNRKCPYAQYVNDVQSDQKGYEMIAVNQFVEANYMVYLSKSTTYQANCPFLSKIPPRKLTQRSLFKIQPKQHKIISDFEGIKVFTSSMSSDITQNVTFQALQQAIQKIEDPIKIGNYLQTGNIFNNLKDTYSGENSTQKPSLEFLYSLFGKEVNSDEKIIQNDFILKSNLLYSNEEINKFLSNNSDAQKNNLNNLAYQQLGGNDNERDSNLLKIQDQQSTTSLLGSYSAFFDKKVDYNDYQGLINNGHELNFNQISNDNDDNLDFVDVSAENNLSQIIDKDFYSQYKGENKDSFDIMKLVAEKQMNDIEKEHEDFEENEAEFDLFNEEQLDAPNANQNPSESPLIDENLQIQQPQNQPQTTENVPNILERPQQEFELNKDENVQQIPTMENQQNITETSAQQNNDSELLPIENQDEEPQNINVPKEVQPANQPPTDQQTQDQNTTYVAPVEVKPVQEELVEPQPQILAPVDEEPAEVKPVEPQPLILAPVDEEPAEVKPVEPQPLILAPVEEEPAEVKPAQEEHVDEEPAEVKPAQEEPVEPQPQILAPVDEQPAEVKPAQEVSLSDQLGFQNIVDKFTPNDSPVNEFSINPNPPKSISLFDQLQSVKQSFNPENENLLHPVSLSSRNLNNQISSNVYLHSGRKLQALPKQYQTAFCFTGFGQKSEKQLIKNSDSEPNIQDCIDLYINDPFSLKNLQEVN